MRMKGAKKEKWFFFVKRNDEYVDFAIYECKDPSRTKIYKKMRYLFCSSDCNSFGYEKLEEVPSGVLDELILAKKLEKLKNL